MTKTMSPDIAELIRQAENLEQSARAHRNEAGDPYRDRNGTAAYTAQMQDQDAASLRIRIKRMQAKRTADLAAIHASAKQAGMPEDAYRVRVRVASGGQIQDDGSVVGGRTDSAGALTAAERTALLNALNAGQTKRRPRRAGRPIKPEALDRQSMLGVVNALLTQVRKSTAYAEGILRQQRGHPKGTASPIEMATDPELRAVIAALDRQAKRQAAAGQSPRR
jgi:hypothetical protein